MRQPLTAAQTNVITNTSDLVLTFDVRMPRVSVFLFYSTRAMAIVSQHLIAVTRRVYMVSVCFSIYILNP